jgi:hypothetical protein
MVMEGLSSKDLGVQFHVACFYVTSSAKSSGMTRAVNA